MKNVLVALILIGSASAHAETELSCWNIFAKKGSQPILKAQISEGNALKVVLNAQDEFFASYIYDLPVYQGHKTGDITQPTGVVTPTLNDSARSPYKGNNEYSLEIGNYNYDSTGYKRNGSVGARLVLPQDLSSDSFKNFRIRMASERSNAVMILDPSGAVSQGGATYLRMFCTSK